MQPGFPTFLRLRRKTWIALTDAKSLLRLGQEEGSWWEEGGTGGQGKAQKGGGA